MTEERIKVLLADDHALFREGVASLLSRDPRIVVIGQCGDGLKVVDVASATEPDVVVLDITLPGLNGLDLCKELRRKVEAAAILIVTMHSSEQCILDALENGASGYLLKEADPGQFCEAIRAVAGGQVYLGAGIPRSVLDRLNRNESDPYKRLTLREKQVLQMVAEGKTNRQIAADLGISIRTADTHRNRLMQKLDLHSQTELVKYALSRGIISLS